MSSNKSFINIKTDLAPLSIPKMKLNKNISEVIDNLKNIFIEKSEYLIPIIVIGSLVTFVIYQIYSAINDKERMVNLTTHVYLIMIPVILTFAYMIYIIFDNETKYMFFAIAATLIVGFAIIYASLKASSYFKFNLTINNLFYYLLIGSIIIFGLIVFYNIFENQLRSTDTWTSFWIDIIFYIPCMLDMFIKYITNDYANTSTRIIILFIIEIILFICYFFVYPMFKNSIYNNGTIVMKNPVFLNSVHSNLIQRINAVHANKMPPVQTDNPLNFIMYQNPSTFTFIKNYSISIWAYINPMPMSRLGYAEETNIFLYGRGWNSSIIPDAAKLQWDPFAEKPTENPQTTKIQEYHPRLTMTQVNDNYLFNFYYSKNEVKHQLEIPLQKWNNIVFNYIENGVDVFINGELTLSYNFTDDMPDYHDDDDIIVGDENGYINVNANAIYGSICNIVYYNRPLTKGQIVFNYNLLKLQNPPIL
jgi:hypothetical protein